MKKLLVLVGAPVLAIVTALAYKAPDPIRLQIRKGSHIILIGNNLGSRMMNFDHFETELQLRYPDSMLYVRNMCDGGNTPGFRPHSGRPTPWAFPGAEKFQTELATSPGTEGFLEYPDAWITKHQADIIIAFFFFGKEGFVLIKIIAFNLDVIDGEILALFLGLDSPKEVLREVSAVYVVEPSLQNIERFRLFPECCFLFAGSQKMLSTICTRA